MVLTKEQFKQRVEEERRERFDIEKADLETRKFRKLCLKYKEELKGLAMKAGNKTYYFDGAGNHKIMYRVVVLGGNTKRFTLPKDWVVYGDENPEMRKAILKEIARIKSKEGDNGNVFKESYQQKKNETEGRPSQEDLPMDFIKASDLI